MHTLTEENYLKAIYKLSESGMVAISTNSVAEKMQTKAASVTDMLKKLSHKKLISYKKYKGFSLSPSGEKVALAIIRKHRLWELFLVEKLNFSWDEVHEIAEQLEHIKSKKLVESLDAYLGFPKADPHGDPIPDTHGKFRMKKSRQLSEIENNKKVWVTGVIDHSPAFLRFLDKNGIALGAQVIIEDKTEYDSSMTIRINKKIKMHLSHQVAKNILISENAL